MRTSAIRPAFGLFHDVFLLFGPVLLHGARGQLHVACYMGAERVADLHPTLDRLRIRPSALQNQTGWDLRCACYKAEDAQPQRHLRSLAYSSSYFYDVYVKYLRSHRYFSSSASSSPFHLEYLYLSACSHFPVEFTSFALIILKKWKVSKRKPQRT
jgi:hypothetical protein